MNYDDDPNYGNFHGAYSFIMSKETCTILDNKTGRFVAEIEREGKFVDQMLKAFLCGKEVGHREGEDNKARALRELLGIENA